MIEFNSFAIDLKKIQIETTISISFTIRFGFEKYRSNNKRTKKRPFMLNYKINCKVVRQKR